MNSKDAGGSSSWFVHRAFRMMMALYSVLIRLAGWIGPSPRPVDGKGYDILLTGTFYSDNWIASHLGPLARSTRCARIRMVATTPVPAINKVEAVYPPAWMVGTIGAVPARLLTFFRVALTTHPHFIGGFHLLVNGLVAALVARLAGAKSVYFCVGGPREVVDGGIWSENRLFRRLRTPDAVVERELARAVGRFDLVVTMGSGAVQFFRSKGVETNFRVVSGGMDGNRYRPGVEPRSVDLITVSRIGAVKRIDLFLEAVKCLTARFPDVKATIVGDGPLRKSLEAMARDLGIERNVRFVGRQDNVDVWLNSAKVFILTSDSEGLSLALMEAMLCGLPAVVSHVGDLGELVQHGENGYLVLERTPEAFASFILDILADSERLDRFSKSARKAAERFDTGSVAMVWNDILNQMDYQALPLKELR